MLPRPVRHLEVGRYFSHFSCGRYHPLPYMLRLFPSPPVGRRDGLVAIAVRGEPYTGREAGDNEPPTAWLGEWPFLQRGDLSFPM